MKFEMDGKIYETDKRTIDVLDSIIPSAKKTNDCSAVAVVMTLGLEQKVIKEINNSRQPRTFGGR